MDNDQATTPEKFIRRTPWNRGKIVGAKPP
jgi:hypothetical protein